MHGHTTAETDDAGQLIRAEVRLPVKLTINTPSGMREAGTGMAEVVAAHEFVHALGQAPHNSHLMAQTLHKVLGDRPSGDKLKAGAVVMPRSSSPTTRSTCSRASGTARGRGRHRRHPDRGSEIIGK